MATLKCKANLAIQHSCNVLQCPASVILLKSKSDHKSNGLLNETFFFLYSKISRNIWGNNESKYDFKVYLTPLCRYVPGFSRVRAHTFGGPQRTRIVDVLTRLLPTNVIWGVHTKKRFMEKTFFDRKTVNIFFWQEDFGVEFLKTSSAVKGDIDFFP